MSFNVMIDSTDVSDYIIDLSGSTALFRLDDFGLVTPQCTLTAVEGIDNSVSMVEGLEVIIKGSDDASASDRVLFSGKIEVVNLRQNGDIYKLTLKHDFKDSFKTLVNNGEYYTDANLTGYGVVTHTTFTINSINPKTINPMDLLEYYFDLAGLNFGTVPSAVDAIVLDSGASITISNSEIDLKVLKCAGTDYATSNLSDLYDETNEVLIIDIIKDLLKKLGLILAYELDSGVVKYSVRSVRTALENAIDYDDTTIKQEKIIKLANGFKNLWAYFANVKNDGDDTFFIEYYTTHATGSLFDITEDRAFYAKYNNIYNLAVGGGNLINEDREFLMSNVVVGKYSTYGGGGFKNFRVVSNADDIKLIYAHFRDYKKSTLVPENLLVADETDFNFRVLDNFKANSNGVSEIITHIFNTEFITLDSLVLTFVDPTYKLHLYVENEGLDNTTPPLNLDTFFYTDYNKCSYRLQQGASYPYTYIDATITYISYSAGTNLHKYEIAGGTIATGSNSYSFSVNYTTQSAKPKTITNNFINAGYLQSVST